MDIKVYENDIDKALEDLKRQLHKGGVLRGIRKRRFYEKPSRIKNRKRTESRKKRLLALRYKKPP